MESSQWRGFVRAGLPVAIAMSSLLALLTVVPLLLAAPRFAEAAGVLEMIARSPKERELYEARLKMQRDEQSRLNAAKDQGHAEGLEQGLERGLEQGLEQGRKQGRLLGRIQLLESLLGLAESSPDDLASKSVSELSAMESDLQQQLRDRG